MIFVRVLRGRGELLMMGNCNCVIVLFSVEKIASAPMHLFWEGNFQNYESELFHLLLASSQKFSLWQIAINHFQAYDSFSTIIFSNLLIIKSRNSHGKNNGLEAVNKQKMFTIEQWGKPFEIFFVECCYAAYSSLWNPQLFFQTSLHIAMKWNFPLFSSMFDQWKCW